MARPLRSRRRPAAILTGLGLVELVSGPGPMPRTWAFHDEPARRAAWRAHRDLVLSKSAPGRAPWALWQYDVPALGDLPDTHLFLDNAAERAERQARQDALDQTRRAWLTLHPLAHRGPVLTPFQATDEDDDTPNAAAGARAWD